MKKILFTLIVFVCFNLLGQNNPEFDKIDNSVVLIKIYDFNGELFGHASGFVIDSSGVILTNYHVVDGASYLKVVFDKDGIKKTYNIESIIGINPSVDLATIKIARTNTNEIFQPLKLSKLQPKKGEKCWAIGTPADPEYMNTISEGIISNIYKDGIYDWKGCVIQTTAEITHGSSGGVLVNKLGEAVGVTCGGDETQNGARASINFAMSVNELLNLSNINKKVYSLESKEKTSQTKSVSYAKLSFYTNSFINGSLDLYIDGIYVGVITKKINCNGIPECESKELLSKNVSLGKHNYYVYCKNTGEYIKGEITTLNNLECKLVKINLKENQKPSLNYKKPITINVVGSPDAEVFLIKYFGNKLFYADTACLINGTVTFEGEKQQPGIVGLYLPGQRYFEFVYNNEEVQLETTGPDFMATMKVKKSAENTVFIPYVNFISGKKSNINKLAEERSKLKNQDPKDPEYKRLSDQIDGINTEVEDYQKLLINNNQGKLVAKIVKMSMEIEIPEPPKNDKGVVIDSTFKYKYYRKHYWDNVDLKDDALVNNPVFHNKMEYYFGKNMIIQHWDTVIAHAFDFCDRLNPKSKMFEYVVGWVASTYGKSEIMGMDKVYLYMLDRYFCTKNAEGKYPAFWVDEAKIPELCDNLKNKLNLVMGVRPPNLILRDTTDVTYRDFYSLKSEYTILYFWDPECGHCKKTTPKLGRLYEEKLKARNVEVFAIGKATGKDFESWKKFIRDNNLKFINVAVTEKLFEIAKKEPEKLVPMYPGEKGKPTTLESLNYQTTYDIFSNPVVYILDKDKNIIAKRVSISQIEDILDRLQNKTDSPKLFPPDPEEDEQMQKKE